MEGERGARQLKWHVFFYVNTLVGGSWNNSRMDVVNLLSEET
jgi:hypothetical protein